MYSFVKNFLNQTMRIITLIITLFITTISFSQKGTINGIITDKEYKDQPLAFANVSIKGTSLGVATDETGKYSIKVEPGKYVLVIGYTGYQTVEIPLNIASNEVKTLNYSLKASGVELKNLVITKSARKNTETAVLNEIKIARQVVNAISAQQMSKGTDGNAAQAIQRVPGVTIVDGKFVMVRGLSERYNNVLINNSIAPSTEVDRRTFSFDLLPTTTLEKMTIGKTGAAYLPGDFAGGIISITTSENFSDFTQLSLNVGYRVNTTFGDYFQTDGSQTDLLGYDNGFRLLPGGFPRNSNVLNDNKKSAFYANNLENNFSPNKSTAFLDNGIGFSIGRNIKLKNNRKLSTVNILSYSNKFENYDKNVNTFINNFSGGNNVPQTQRVFVDNFNSNESKLTILSNWSLKFNDNNKINFKNLFNQIGENNTTLREGQDFGS